MPNGFEPHTCNSYYTVKLTSFQVDKDELVDAILREYDDDDGGCDYEALPIQTSGVGSRLKGVVGGEDE